jgi:hypothetical protein
MGLGHFSFKRRSRFAEFSVNQRLFLVGSISGASHAYLLNNIQSHQVLRKYTGPKATVVLCRNKVIKYCSGHCR